MIRVVITYQRFDTLYYLVSRKVNRSWCRWSTNLQDAWVITPEGATRAFAAIRYDHFHIFEGRKQEEHLVTTNLGTVQVTLVPAD